MIVVKIELWPNGDKDQARLQGIGFIANDGTGTVSVGNYDVHLSHSGKYLPKDGSAPGIWKTGKITGFHRRKSVYELIALAFGALTFCQDAKVDPKPSLPPLFPFPVESDENLYD